jgi:Ca2+-binding RTX toxin-like protein
MPNYKAILSGQSWNAPSGLKISKKPVFLTYSFNVSDWDSTKFGSADRAMARKALKMWGDASGIRFIEVKGREAELKFQWQWEWDFVTAWAEFPELNRTTFDDGDMVRDSSGGNVYLNTQHRAEMSKNKVFKLYILLHEIGHALGLKHPFHKMDHNKELLRSDLDHVTNTVMSYAGDDPTMQSVELGSLDIEAIRALYGSPSQDGRQVAKWSWSNAKQTLTQIGKSKADVIFGVAVKDVIKGGSGNDKIYGFDGNDTLYGDNGIDLLSSGEGDDRPDGGSGDDRLSSGEGKDTLYGGVGNDRLSSGEGNDTLQGGAGSDTLKGGEDNDTLYGDADRDFLNGGYRRDKLYGGTGNDVLNGDFGNDTLNGGTGSDRLTGAEGSDRFVFDTPFNGVDDVDQITDFDSGWDYDKIVLSSSVFTALQASFLSEEAFVDGTIATEEDDRIIFDNLGERIAYYDPDGSGSAAPVAFAKILGFYTIGASDFLVV